jgi:hypothetical protein
MFCASCKARLGLQAPAAGRHPDPARPYCRYRDRRRARRVVGLNSVPYSPQHSAGACPKTVDAALPGLAAWRVATWGFALATPALHPRLGAAATPRLAGTGRVRGKSVPLLVYEMPVTSSSSCSSSPPLFTKSGDPRLILVYVEISRQLVFTNQLG